MKELFCYDMKMKRILIENYGNENFDSRKNRKISKITENRIKITARIKFTNSHSIKRESDSEENKTTTLWQECDNTFLLTQFVSQSEIENKSRWKDKQQREGNSEKDVQ
jgi:hypothetical protein